MRIIKKEEEMERGEKLNWNKVKSQVERGNRK